MISLIAGLVWFLWIGSAVAIITGHLARREVREQGLAGDTLAIVGLVLGYLGAASFGLFVLIPLLLAGATR